MSSSDGSNSYWSLNRLFAVVEITILMPIFLFCSLLYYSRRHYYPLSLPAATAILPCNLCLALFLCLVLLLLLGQVYSCVLSVVTSTVLINGIGTFLICKSILLLYNFEVSKELRRIRLEQHVRFFGVTN